MRKLSFLAAATALFIGSMAEAQQRQIIFREGLNGYIGTHDSFLRTGDPTQNVDFTNHFENRPFELEWDGSDGGGRNLAVFKFPDIIGNGPNQIPVGSTIVSANLRTFIINNSTRTDTDVAYRLLKDWDETTVTFSNYFDNVDPTAIGSTSANDPGEALIEASGYVALNSKVRGFHIPEQSGAAFFLDVSPITQDWANGEPNFGFVIMVVAGGNGFGHVSSEGIFYTRAKIDELKAVNDPTVDHSIFASAGFPGFGENISPSLVVETPGRTYTFQQGENGYADYQDSYISSRGALLDSDDGRNHLYTYPLGFEGAIRMDVSTDFTELGLVRYGNIIGTGPGQIPPGTTINSAKIRFFVMDTSEEVNIHEIKPFTGTNVDGLPVNTDWNEDTATFSNMIEDGGFPQFGKEITTDSPISSFFPATNYDFTEADVTASIQKYANGTLQNLGWMFEVVAGDDVTFVGKEGSQVFGAPALIVDYIPPAGTEVNTWELY